MAAQVLLDLPVETLINIFALLDARHIVRCSAVCTYFKEVIGNSIELQYHIELAICGYDGLPNSAGEPTTPAIRLDKLRKHIDAWNNLDWAETRVNVPREFFVSVLSGGVYATATNNSLVCVQFPSRTRGTSLRRWTLENVDRTLWSIAIDPPNDLLVFASQTMSRGTYYSALHIRTLSDYTLHPSAIHPVLDSNDNLSPNSVTHGTLRIMGLSLGIARIYGDRATLEIWNWRTGRRVCRLVLGKEVNTMLFAFTSATSFILPRFVDAAVDVYQFSPDDSDVVPTCIPVLDVPFPEAGTPEHSIEFFANVIPSYGDGGQVASTNPSVFPLPLFRVGGDSHNIGFQMRRTTFYQNSVQTLLCRSGRPLHHYASAVGDINRSVEGDLCSNADHTLPGRPRDDWRRGDFVDDLRGNGFFWYELYGGRVIRVCLPDADGRRRLYLYDFNQNRASRRRPPTSKSGVSEGPSSETAMAGGMTQDNLPLCASRVLDWNGFRLMCDDEHIILTEHSYSPNDETEWIILTM